MSNLYPRPQLAADLARKLLRTKSLDTQLLRGLFLPGPSRTGKTSFLLYDLMPALQKLGALVIYVDLLAQPNISPYHVACNAIRKTLKPHSPSGILDQFLRAIGIRDLKFNFNPETIGKNGGIALVEALMAIIDQSQTDVVLIVDDVQLTMTSDEEPLLLHELKEARDAINLRPETPGSFVFIGTGSPPALVNELRGRNNHAFYGATSLPYPVLGEDYVEFLLTSLEREGYSPLPNLEVATGVFKTLEHRPEAILKAFQQLLLHSAPYVNPNKAFPLIADDLRSPAAAMI
ncbi:hypothetical protein AGMMS49545_11370 [Betaproteobacteria bacterium]|nr:hypothetical protein AGMMS49545_11370 [Betaproteobacteria bacterium]GHU42152.1 hypothetical protein AGMMS50289_06420 [Betaproteobacteria bacterium]